MNDKQDSTQAVIPDAAGHCRLLRRLTTAALLGLSALFLTQAPAARAEEVQKASPQLQKRWLFIWRNMDDPKEVQRVLDRMPQAARDGYNGVALSGNVAAAKAGALKDAARQNHLDLIALVMGGMRDRNDVEGVLSRDALFVAQGATAVFQPDNPTKLNNADFEVAQGNPGVWPPTR